MRILFCTSQRVDESGGFSRIQIRLGEELRRTGHEVEILGPEATGCRPEYRGGRLDSAYAVALRHHLIAHAGEFDVVEYDDEHLPFPRTDFPAKTLMVSRSVLLPQYAERIQFPERVTLRGLAGRVVYGRARARVTRERIVVGDATLRSADLVNLANPRDRDEVVARGIDPSRVVVIPYALATEVREALLDASVPEPPSAPVVAFVGTFDYRKGAMSFGLLFQRLAEAVPGVRLRLLGCKGAFRDEVAIRSFFPANLRDRVEVVMSFPREDLARLLADCSLGVFPSYLESFGLGVLEMMSASLPVIAFDAPGPPVMVPPDLLVAPGDAERMAAIANLLLRDPDRLRRERERARAIAQTFTWEISARQTALAYAEGCERLTSTPAFAGIPRALSSA